MEMMQAIINGCTQILSYNIYLLGYYISLMNVIAFAIIGYILLRVLFRLFG